MCILEKDNKTYDYFKRYLAILGLDDIKSSLETSLKIENLPKKVFFLDNMIQKEEIELHLEANKHILDQPAEALNWIEKNGKGFRNYLQTIKIACVAWSFLRLPYTDFTWTKFCNLVDEFNSLERAYNLF